MPTSRPRRSCSRPFPASPPWPASIGDPAVRNRGTIGGSIANNDPAADYPAAALALGATIVTNKRKIPADAVLHRPVRDGARAGRDRREGLLPDPVAAPPTPSSATRPRATRMVGVFVAKRGSDVRVAVTGAGAERRVPRHEPRGGAEEALLAEVARRHDRCRPPASTATSTPRPDYRAHLIVVMAKRAVTAAIGK